MTKTTPTIDTPLYLAYIAAQEALDSRCEHPRMDGDTCAECGESCSHADVGAVDDGICHDDDCPIHGGDLDLAEARDAALAAYIASDEPREWTLIEAGHAYDTVVGTMAEAIEAAMDHVVRSNDTKDGTIWIDVEVRCYLTGERDSATVRLDPAEPECIHGDGHDDTAKALRAGVKYLDAIHLDDDYAYYANETDRWYLVSRNEIVDLGRRLLAHDQDAYSFWCADGHGDEVGDLDHDTLDRIAQASRR